MIEDAAGIAGAMIRRRTWKIARSRITSGCVSLALHQWDVRMLNL